jgi:mRNA interferase MazF
LEKRLTRGDIWTSASGADYGGKPRPVVIIQHQHFDYLDSVTFCGFTRDPADLPFFRVAIGPSESNGLEFPSRIMVDKILTTPKTKLGYRIGQLDARDVARLNQALALFLGLID